MQAVLDATLELSNLLRTLLSDTEGNSYAYPQHAEDITLDTFPTFITLPFLTEPMTMGVKSRGVSWFSVTFDIRLFLDQGEAKTAVELAPIELKQWKWIEDVSRLLFANMQVNGTLDITGNTTGGDQVFLTPRIGYVTWDNPQQYWGVYFSLVGKVRSTMTMKA